MKKILTTVAFVSALFISGPLFASAYYTPYYNVYQNAPTSNSYIYTSGCYRYQYDAYTQVTSLLGSTCTTNTNNYYNSYSYGYTYPTTYTYPTYSYTPSTYQNTYSYTYQPYTYPASQYYTYSYNNTYGTWGTGGSFYRAPTCYWYGGYQVCN